MAFDIMSLFSPQARNMLMQPFATNPDNLLIAPQMHDYPVAGIPQNALTNPQASPMPQNVPVPTPMPPQMQQQAAPQAPQQAPWMVPALGQGSPRINDPQMVAAGSQPTIGSMFGGAPQGQGAPQHTDPMMTGSTQPNAPGMAPQGAPAQQGGLASFFSPDRKQSLNDFFTGLAAGSTPGQSFALGAAAVSQGSKSRSDQNATEAWLGKQGMDPNEARTLAKNPTALNEYLRSTFQKPQNELLPNGKGSFYDRQSGQWISPPPGADNGMNEYGLQPLYGTDANGKPTILQLGKNGVPIQPHLPDGFVPTPAVQQMDLGTHVLTQTKYGAPVSDQQKDVTGRSNQEAIGAGAGAAAIMLPQAEQLSSQIDQQVKALKEDPSLPNVLGPINSRTPTILPSSVAVQAKIDQLKGGAFLTARQLLKGGGAITDYEGQKAESAFARMNQAQSVQDFNSALDDFNSAVKQGVANLQRQKAMGTTGTQPPAAPQQQSDPLGIR
jgi:hypothetical protein